MDSFPSTYSGHLGEVNMKANYLKRPIREQREPQ